MIVIAMLCQKGGVGKTTLVESFSVEALSTSGKKVAVIDIDPQRSFVKWASRRLETFPDEENRVIAIPGDHEELESHLEACREGGVDIVFIDTPAKVEQPASVAARLSDFAIIPTGISINDLEALGDTVSITEAVKIPSCIVVNMAEPSSKVTNEMARKKLGEFRSPGICPYFIFRRIVAKHAPNNGCVPYEIEPANSINAEISAVWAWISRKYIQKSIRSGRAKKAA